MNQNLWTCSCDHCLRWRKAFLLMAAASVANARGDDAALQDLAVEANPDVLEIQTGLEAFSADFELVGRAAADRLRGVLTRDEKKTKHTSQEK